MKQNCNLVVNAGDSPIMCKGEAHLTDTPTEGFVHAVYEPLPGTWSFDRGEGIFPTGTSTEFTYTGSAARLSFQVSFGFETDTQETRHFMAVFKNGVLQARSISQCFVFFNTLEERNMDLTATVPVVSGDVLELQMKIEDEPTPGPSNLTLITGSFTVLGGS